MHFRDPENMKHFMDSKLDSVRGKQDSLMGTLKKEMNTIINALYEDVASYAFSIDPYRLPVHGIANPVLENPVNLFQRQLKIEQLSFELSHTKYRKSLDDLIRVGKAD